MTGSHEVGGSIPILKVSCGAIAQLGERVTGSHEVGGSIPPSSTNFLFKKPGTACQLQIFSKVRKCEWAKIEWSAERLNRKFPLAL